MGPMSVPLLVFLHGLGGSPPFWQEQVSALPDGVRAVAPWLDGLRPGRPAGFEPERAADAVLAQLNRFGVDSMALVGTGLGALVATIAAGRSPEAVSHLVVSEVPPRPKGLSRWVQRAAMAGAELDVRPWLGSVTAATLVITGQADAAARAATAELAAGIAGARLEVVASARGPVPTAAPAEYNRLLYAFLEAAGQ